MTSHSKGKGIMGYSSCEELGDPSPFKVEQGVGGPWTREILRETRGKGKRGSRQWRKRQGRRQAVGETTSEQSGDRPSILGVLYTSLLFVHV